MQHALSFPPLGHKALSHGTIESFREIVSQPGRLPFFRETLLCSADTNTRLGSRSFASICLRADGQIWLVSFGKKGGWRKLWNFTPRKAQRA